MASEASPIVGIVLKKSDVGKRVECRIDDSLITGVLEREDLGAGSSFWHICQNQRDGNRCSRLHGYTFSWAFTNYNNGEMTDGVSHLRFLDTEWDE